MCAVSVRDVTRRLRGRAGVRRPVARHRARASSSSCSAPRAAASRPCSTPSPACSRSPTGQIWIGGAQRHLGGAQGPRHRHGVPVLRALSAHERAREHVLRPARWRRRPRPRSSSASPRPRRAAADRATCSTAGPDQLSGGQRQRVAIGRALVRDAAVFLFDEPLSNLDAQLRNELRVEIKRLHPRLGTTTMIYVTHDQIEAMTLADRIAVMKEQRIQQLGTPGRDLSPPGQSVRRRLRRLAADELHQGPAREHRRRA